MFCTALAWPGDVERECAGKLVDTKAIFGDGERVVPRRSIEVVELVSRSCGRLISSVQDENEVCGIDGKGRQGRVRLLQPELHEKILGEVPTTERDDWYLQISNTPMCLRKRAPIACSFPNRTCTNSLDSRKLLQVRCQ